MKKGAVNAIQDLYEVVHHEVLSVDMRSAILFIICSAYSYSQICMPMYHLIYFMSDSLCI
jgi:hypothetical protein